MNTKNSKLKANHYNMLMVKANRIYEDMVIRLKRAEASGTMFIEQDIKQDIPETSTQIFEQALTNIIQDIDQANKNEIIMALSLVLKTKVPFEMHIEDLRKLEQKICEMNDFTDTDLINLVTSFIAMKYEPKKIIEQINESENFITIGTPVVKDLLDSLMEIKYSVQPNIYNKIFEKIKLVSHDMEVNEICKILNCISTLNDQKIIQISDQGIK